MCVFYVFITGWRTNYINLGRAVIKFRNVWPSLVLP